MTLQIVGAGFGRTGTLSLKGALERLGFSRCYHMLEVFENPSHVDQWIAAVEGRPVDWDALFTGYAAAVDWPACNYWQALSRRYPDAKVLLTVRDPERWHESVMNTIYQVLSRPLPEAAPAQIRRQLDMARRIVLEESFDGRLEDRAHAIAVFERHNRSVRESCDPDRLLVYEVAEGWEPLCTFLDRPVPDEPFPRVNDTESFRARMTVPAG